jgi:hypothetical protein
MGKRCTAGVAAQMCWWLTLHVYTKCQVGVNTGTMAQQHHPLLTSGRLASQKNM